MLRRVSFTRTKLIGSKASFYPYKPPRISLEGEFMKPRMKCVTAGGKAFTADRIWPEKYFPEKVNLNNCTNTFRIYCWVTV